MPFSIEASKQLQRDYMAKVGPIPPGTLKWAANNGKVDEYLGLVKSGLETAKPADWTAFVSGSQESSKEAKPVAAS